MYKIYLLLFSFRQTRLGSITSNGSITMKMTPIWNVMEVTIGKFEHFVFIVLLVYQCVNLACFQILLVMLPLYYCCKHAKYIIIRQTQIIALMVTRKCTVFHLQLAVTNWWGVTSQWAHTTERAVTSHIFWHFDVRIGWRLGNNTGKTTNVRHQKDNSVTSSEECLVADIRNKHDSFIILETH